VEALQDFITAYDIDFPLLSDPRSEIIRQFGILNTLIKEDDHPWFGIPFPGTYVIDADGVITHKFFENNLALRASPEQLVRALQGESLTQTRAATASTDAEPVIYLDGAQLAVSVMRDLVVSFEVPAGRHLYAAPAPEGMIAASVELEPLPNLVQRPTQMPDSHEHTMATTAETFAVHDGHVEFRIPLTVNGNVAATAGEEGPTLTVTGRVNWQMCDNEVCDVPRQEPFALRLPVHGAVVSELEAKPDGKLIRAMNGKAHFQKLATRHGQS